MGDEQNHDLVIFYGKTSKFYGLLSLNMVSFTKWKYVPGCSVSGFMNHEVQDESKLRQTMEVTD